MAGNELLSEIKKGDRAAFDEFCRGELPVLSSYARAFLDEEWADDVVQDVLFSFWQNRGRINTDYPIRSYLLRSVYNRSMNYLRRQKLAADFREWNDMRIMELGLEGSDPDRNPVIRRLFDGDLRESLTKAIDSLPARCREVFIKSYIEDKTNKEISMEMDISLSTVENHMYKALKLLRLALSDDKAFILFAAVPYLWTLVTVVR